MSEHACDADEGLPSIAGAAWSVCESQSMKVRFFLLAAAMVDLNTYINRALLKHDYA